MNTIGSIGIRAAIVAGVLVLSGCVSYSTPYYASDGVYYGDRYAATSRTYVRYVDPGLYPYWSLDYFYIGRHYRPYSVVVNYHDPWFNPSYRQVYWPRYGYTSYYHGYRPWQGSLWFNYRYYSDYRYRRDHSSRRTPRGRPVDARAHDIRRRSTPTRPTRSSSRPPSRIPERNRRVEPNRPTRPPEIRAPQGLQDAPRPVIHRQRTPELPRAAAGRTEFRRPEPPQRTKPRRNPMRSSTPSRPRTGDRAPSSRSRQSIPSRRDRQSGDRRDH